MKKNLEIETRTATYILVAISLVYGVYGFLKFWGLMP